MNIRRLFIVVLVLAAAAIPLGAALAKGVVSVTISGPGLKTEIEVTDPDTMESLMGLIGNQVFTKPTVGDTFYTVSMGIGDPATGQVFATNVYHYYPDPLGKESYVLFTSVEGGSSSAEGQWFRATTVGEQALQQVLAGYGVSIAGSKSNLPVVAAEQPAKEPETSSPASKSAVAGTSALAIAGPDNRMMMAALGVLAILLVGGTLVIRRRQQAEA